MPTYLELKATRKRRALSAVTHTLCLVVGFAAGYQYLAMTLRALIRGAGF